MGTVKNKDTGISYPATSEEIKAIQGNELIADKFEFQETQTPEEVQDLQQQATVKELKNQLKEINQKIKDTNAIDPENETGANEKIALIQQLDEQKKAVEEQINNLKK